MCGRFTRNYTWRQSTRCTSACIAICNLRLQNLAKCDKRGTNTVRNRSKKARDNGDCHAQFASISAGTTARLAAEMATVAPTNCYYAQKPCTGRRTRLREG